jgi:hypothetical protein
MPQCNPQILEASQLAKFEDALLHRAALAHPFGCSRGVTTRPAKTPVEVFRLGRYPAGRREGKAMDQLKHLIDALRTYPSLAVGVGAAAVAVAFLLFRKPQIQRDADARLSALRRDKNDQYTKLRLHR